MPVPCFVDSLFDGALFFDGSDDGAPSEIVDFSHTPGRLGLIRQKRDYFVAEFLGRHPDPQFSLPVWDAVREPCICGSLAEAKALTDRFVAEDLDVVKAHFILYVADQRRSTEFYRSVLGRAPRLDVPGMTEFELAQGAVLGLMPEDGIARLLGPGIAHPSLARAAPRSELYLVVDDAAAVHARAVESGAREVSPVAPRDWGDVVGYSLDPDGHVLAVASSPPGEA